MGRQHGRPPLPDYLLNARKDVQYRPRSSCVTETKHRTPHETCPRCDEVAGAGICPEAGAVGNFALEFDRTFVLCAGLSCHRHRTGYWPPDVHSRLNLFEADELDSMLAVSAGPKVARLLGIGKYKFTGRWYEQPGTAEFRYTRHRIVALLATLHLVKEAARRGLESVLILEGDVRPLSNLGLYSMAPDEVKALGHTLRRRPWSVLRLHGYFYPFAFSRKGLHRMPANNGTFGPGECPAACACKPVGEPVHKCRQPTRMRGRYPERGSRCVRACEIAPAASGTYGCVVKDTVAFAVHKRAYGAFLRQSHRAVEAIERVADQVTCNQGTCINKNEFEQLNETWGMSRSEWDAALPWFDVWLPQALPNIYIVPSIAAQQVKQGDADTSVHFAQHCLPQALSDDAESWQPVNYTHGTWPTGATDSYVISKPQTMSKGKHGKPAPLIARDRVMQRAQRQVRGSA